MHALTFPLPHPCSLKMPNLGQATLPGWEQTSAAPTGSTDTTSFAGGVWRTTQQRIEDQDAASSGELQQGQAGPTLPTPHSPAGLLEFGLGWQLRSCWKKPRAPRLEQQLQAGRILGKPRQLLHFSRQGQLSSSHPASQQHRLGIGGGKRHRQVGQTGGNPSILLLPMDPAMAKSLSLHLSGAGLGASLRSEARCAWQNLDLWVQHPQQHALNPVCHPKVLTPPEPQRCPDVQAQTGSPGGI